MSALDDFLVLCAAEICRRAELTPENQAALRQGAKVFAAATDQATPVVREHTTVPVVQHLAERAALSDSPLVDAFRAAVDEIPWIASLRMTDLGTQAALAPLGEVRDFGDLTVGLMLVGPGCSYPEHSHPPQELYLPLSGDGEWRYGGRSDYRSVSADTLVYNHPNGRHGAHAQATVPLLALYVLWP